MMALIRAIVCCVFAIIGSVSLVVAIATGPSRLGEYSFQNSQDILADFEKVAALSEDFRRAEGRPPVTAELLAQILEKRPDFKNFRYLPKPLLSNSHFGLLLRKGHVALPTPLI